MGKLSHGTEADGESWMCMRGVHTSIDKIMIAFDWLTSNQNKVPLKTIDQLLIHNSDTAVKPIIGNKDIER